MKPQIAKYKACIGLVPEIEIDDRLSHGTAKALPITIVHDRNSIMKYQCCPYEQKASFNRVIGHYIILLTSLYA